MWHGVQSLTHLVQDMNTRCDAFKFWVAGCGAVNERCGILGLMLLVWDMGAGCGSFIEVSGMQDVVNSVRAMRCRV